MSDKAYNNPSYDKSLSPEKRLADFLGKFHIVLNGVVAHDPFEKTGEDGTGMCCENHKTEIIEFVHKLVSSEFVSKKELRDGIELFFHTQDQKQASFYTDDLIKFLLKE